MQIGKIPDIFPKKLFENFPFANIRNCLVGRCDRVISSNWKVIETCPGSYISLLTFSSNAGVYNQ